MRASPAILAAVLVAVLPSRVLAQCTEPHYRWSEKIDESFANVAPVRAYITTILATWTLPPYTGQAIYQCWDREGRELRTYSVVGWLRRVKKTESDGDWHAELTSRANSPVDSCIVVEFPPPGSSATYAEARADLDAFLATTTVASNGNLAVPVRVRIIGAAFFDGEHRGGPTRRDQTDGSHGRCNSSARALWEIHPVYWVRPPS